MKLTKMPNPWKNPWKPVHSPGAKQIFVIEFPPPSPTPKISLLSAISDAKPGVNSYAKPGVNSYDGAASPVKRPQLKMETPPKVPEDSSRAKWEKFIEIQQDRPYKRLPFKKPRNA